MKKTERKKKKQLLFPLAREEGEGVAEVQGQSENREKKGGETKRKERAREKKSVRGRGD